MVKLVRGVGINDANYKVCRVETIGYNSEGKCSQRVVWECPFYKRWKNMIERCYAPEKYPTYELSTVCNDWIYFSKFKKWMEHQPWEGNQLDKDIISKGNNLYSPETCRFVPGYINCILLTSGASRGELAIGVCKHNHYKNGPRFMAQCKTTDCDTGLVSNKYLGVFDTELEAHRAWQLVKMNDIYTKLCAYSEDTSFDTRIAGGLLQRIWDLRLDMSQNKFTEEL